MTNAVDALAAGPVLGGVLAARSWDGPFYLYGTSVVVAAANQRPRIRKNVRPQRTACEGAIATSKPFLPLAPRSMPRRLLFAIPYHG